MTKSSLPTRSQPASGATPPIGAGARPTARKPEKRGSHYRPGSSSHALSLGRVLPVTIGELPSHTFQVKPEVEAFQIVKELENDPELPGVLIVRGFECLGMVSRQKCFEQLGRPFGVEVFLNRPIITLKDAIEHELTILPAHTRIDAAVQTALTRPREHRYEPLVVLRADQRFQLLDLPVLLLAQSSLMANANHLVKHQVEIGRALMGTQAPDQVLGQIIERLQEIVPFHRGGLALESEPWLEFVAHHGFPAETPRYRLRALRSKADIYQHLVETRQPLFAADMTSEKRWRYLDDFPAANTWLAVPLQHAGVVIGMLFLVRVCVNMPFTPEDVEIAETFVAQAGVALQNAQLVAAKQALDVRQKELSHYNLPAWSRAQGELREVLGLLTNTAEAMLEVPVEALTEPLRQRYIALQAAGQRLHVLLEQVSAHSPEESRSTISTS